jgi:hypothetical protein
MLPERVGLGDFNNIAYEPDSQNGSPWGTLAEVEMKPIRFVDKPLWQAGAFHLLVGEKGCGKGTYLALLTAQFTRGELGEKCSVIWVAAGEDSLSLDVKPRIVAAGGNPELVIWPKERLLLPSCVEDIRLLGKTLGDVGLILFDPIAGLFDARRSSNYDADVRATIDPLNSLADELDCLVIGVRHFGKDRSRGALQSILGGTDWINVPRAVVGIAMDEKDVRHIQVMAGNRTARAYGRTFMIEGAQVSDFPEPVTKAVFAGASDQDVEALIENPQAKPSPKGQEAREMMLDILDDEGEVESDTLTARVAQETGLAAKTVKNLKTALKDDGLVKFRPIKSDDDEDKIVGWKVYRSLAPRDTSGRGGDTVCEFRDTPESESQDTPVPTPVPSVSPPRDLARARARSTGLNPRTEASSGAEANPCKADISPPLLATDEYVDVAYDDEPAPFEHSEA